MDTQKVTTGVFAFYVNTQVFSVAEIQQILLLAVGFYVIPTSV